MVAGQQMSTDKRVAYLVERPLIPLGQNRLHRRHIKLTVLEVKLVALLNLSKDLLNVLLYDVYLACERVNIPFPPSVLPLLIAHCDQERRSPVVNIYPGDFRV